MKKVWLLAAALCCALPAWAAQDLVMGVSEGTSGGLDHAQVIIKYQGLADVIGRSIKRKVNVVFAREFAQLEDGMKTHRFDFVIARPSDYPARGLLQYGYKFLASAKPDGQCIIIARKDSGIRTVADLKGKRFVMPEPAAYMTKFCRAELRDLGVDLARENVQYVREQGAVAFYLDNKFGDVGGVASYSGVSKKWIKDGLPVVHRSRTQPYFPLIAGPDITEPQRAEIRKALAAMTESPADQAVLKTVGIEAFDTESEPRLRALLDWLGAP
ncbi:PhnD/SsuA/transferrin family substrate-binding protein [Ramlibacter sp. USB13]|uniref:PhnD/SsuA/transferrin family substrate-binding protein n=1 Tax=Ramlibacter cellulosilyticus TaxID=2764187 RepID=A0A923MSL6_9BURK|nr:PhnD/SsuA/transferrin family substrate-binding protein [Ramlibacter cellulosilyticus]MBC5783854.1 PhnD/SsuA/transferrin family substrate-binding protein [Ramlibacter cellulosilyticus]